MSSEYSASYAVFLHKFCVFFFLLVQKPITNVWADKSVIRIGQYGVTIKLGIPKKIKENVEKCMSECMYACMKHTISKY